MSVAERHYENPEEEQELREHGFLLPNQINIDPRFNVRRFDQGEDIEAIQWLAATIERDGQLDDVILVPVEDGRLVLLSGHRRRRAIVLINERRSAQSRPLLKVRYRIDRDGGDLFRKAVISNLQRKDFSPMDLATLISQIRHDHNWEGFKGAKKVSEYLGVSISTVTQTEKFLRPEVSSELRHSLHTGEISAQSAHELMADVPQKRMPEVLQRARDIQTDRNIDQAISDSTSGQSSAEAAAEKLHAKKRIEHAAVRQAIRDTPDIEQAPHPMSRKDIIEFFLQFDGPAYGGINSEVREFVAAFDKMVSGSAGKHGTRIARARFDRMVSKSNKGTPDGENTSLIARAPTGRRARSDRNKPRGKRS